MIAKDVVGLLILLLNAAGLGFLVYLGGQALILHFSPKDPPDIDTVSTVNRDRHAFSEDIVPDEDDLLKDMDLSDLDNLDLDDFD